jgi:catechol 2,3-dioxygenase
MVAGRSDFDRAHPSGVPALTHREPFVMPRLEGLDHVALAVRDVRASAQWYCDVLGLERLHEAAWGDTPAMVGVGGTMLALFPVRGAEPKPPPGKDVLAARHVAFRTDAQSFAEARVELRGRGIEVEFQDHGIAHSIYFRDPDGHELEITTYDLRADPVRGIHPGADVGHVHLKVSDLERAITFYREALGLEVTQRMGSSAAFLSAGGYHHHLGLNTWDSEGGPPPRAGTTGLFHAAFRYPTRPALADALRRLMAHGVRLDGAADHGVSEALYLRDPDDNGIELYWDRPGGAWPRDGAGGLAMYSRPLDVAALAALR